MVGGSEWGNWKSRTRLEQNVGQAGGRLLARNGKEEEVVKTTRVS